MTNADIWPTEIRLRKAEKILEVDFDNGVSFRYAAELLRVESPSAEVQGHSPAQKVTLAGKRQVGISALEQVGNYAVRVLFDDGHSTGIFSWPYLYRLGRDQAQFWRGYLDALEAQGLSR